MDGMLCIVGMHPRCNRGERSMTKTNSSGMSSVSVGVFGVVRESHGHELRRPSDMETNLPWDGAARCGASVHAVLAYHPECHLLIDEDGQLFMSEPTGRDGPLQSNEEQQNLMANWTCTAVDPSLA